jgi:prepilin-type N-terminal cleavage/methylation domain-containing protein
MLMHTIRKQRGFTIIELLVVIVVIGILAAIITVAFNGISEKAAVASLKSDLKNISTQISVYKVNNSSLPATISDFKKSTLTDVEYTVDGDSYCMSASNANKPGTKFYISTQSATIKDGACPSVPSTAIACFAFSAGTITKYYDNEGDAGWNPACPRDVVIPKQINGTTVTSINGGFCGEQLTSISIPNTVTSIGDFTFCSNTLTSLFIPSSVTSIGSWAFAGSTLTSVTLPSSLLTLGDLAFYNNRLTSLVIPNSVTTIGANAFNQNRLTSVTIPSSVTTIGSVAFNNNLLTTASVPATTTLSSDAFDPGVIVTRY